MAKNNKRDCYNYELKQGKKTVYKGISNDPERRAKEHEGEGKKFSHMKVSGPAVIRTTAKKREEDGLKTYRDGHSGKGPKYNKTKKG
jgi:predicted GIY-YIG superfamily endonuclease